KLVAVGDYGRIVVSSDGKKWSRVQSGTLSGLTNVIYAAGKFVVAAGWNNTILTSADGTSWRPAMMDQPTTPGQIHGLAYGNGVFIAARTDGALIGSSDGQEWFHVGQGGVTGNATHSGGSDLVFGNGVFGAAGGPKLLISANGKQWEVTQRV